MTTKASTTRRHPKSSLYVSIILLGGSVHAKSSPSPLLKPRIMYNWYGRVWSHFTCSVTDEILCFMQHRQLRIRTLISCLSSTDVVQWRSTKVCTMFGRLLDCYTIHSFLGALAPNVILSGAKFTSCVLLYWHRYGTALEHWALAKLCGMVSSRDRAAIPFDTV